MVRWSIDIEPYKEYRGGELVWCIKVFLYISPINFKEWTEWQKIVLHEQGFLLLKDPFNTAGKLIDVIFADELTKDRIREAKEKGIEEVKNLVKTLMEIEDIYQRAKKYLEEVNGETQ